MPPGPLMDGRRDPESDHLDPDRSRVRLNKIGSAYELPEAPTPISAQPTLGGLWEPPTSTSAQPTLGGRSSQSTASRHPSSRHGFLKGPVSQPSTGSPSHAAASGALTPLCREPSSMLGVNEPGADAAAGDNGDDLPVSSPSQYRRSSLRAGTALTNWLDGNSPLQPRDADGLQPGGGQGGRALAVRLCSVLAGALREGAACWTVRMVPFPGPGRWWGWPSRAILGGVYPMLDRSCRGYGSQLQLPNALEVSVPVPV